MNDIKEEKIKSNLCAAVGFLLTLLNLVISSAFLITGDKIYLVLFASSTAVLSLIVSLIGLINANKTGKGKFLSVSGIALNVLLLAALAVFCGVSIF